MQIPLRPLLWFDAATCAAMAALLLGAEAALSPLLGLPPLLLREAGLILVPFALFVGWTATRDDPARLARIIIAANLLWVGASLALLVGPWLRPTPIGMVFIGAQAIAVLVITGLQRSASPATRIA
jgi:hypothetical protein